MLEIQPQEMQLLIFSKIEICLEVVGMIMYIVECMITEHHIPSEHDETVQVMIGEIQK
jgi:hypothetical protein